MNNDTRLIISPTTMQVEGGDCNLEDIFRLTLSVQRQALSTMLHQARAEDNREAIEALYDFANQAYGNILIELFPELHNSEITEDLLERTIAAQDAFINQELENLRQTNPRLYKKQQKNLQRHISDMRAKLLERKMKARQIKIEDVVHGPPS